MTVRHLFAAALLLLAACGGRGAIFLTIDGATATGALRVPDDVDKVIVKVTSPDPATVLFEKEYPLASGVSCTSATATCGATPENARFPLTLGLEPGSATGKQVRIFVDASKAEARVAEGNSLVPINSSEVTSVTVRLAPL